MTESAIPCLAKLNDHSCCLRFSWTSQWLLDHQKHPTTQVVSSFPICESFLVPECFFFPPFG